MTCKGCHSDKQGVFNGEVAAHFPGLEGLNKSIAWVFPKLAVCLHCGLAEFIVPERELQVLEPRFSCRRYDRSARESGRPLKNVKVRSVSPGING